ncbi:MAG TPA: endonuclease III [Dissulfurispiraceae bacterium]|nr:endonuclease III [Dissulfurispiraceae bacterium]
MTADEFPGAWLALRKQVKSLNTPWLENYAGHDRDPFKVLISCLLSLRTQDKTTGEASERLFALASVPEVLAGLPVKTIEKAIYPVGFYRVKSQRIKAISREIMKRYGGKVPDTIEELLTLQGVGRKTANLVVILGYDKPGICVDTHVHRIVNRWGLIATKNPGETELKLRELLPVKYWKELNGVLVAFGQGLCRPISPHCSICSVYRYCERKGVSVSR